MMKRIKTVVDSGIPFINGVLEKFSEVVYLPGASIDNIAVKDADALIIRTRTKCDEILLKGSSVKFIASATIGRDHVDEEYCLNNGIIFKNAEGCNAGGVVQYILTTLAWAASVGKPNFLNETVGIIGAGNVGERLAAAFEFLGVKYMRCDPPKRAQLESDRDVFKTDSLRSQITIDDYYSLNEVLRECKIVTLHVPLDNSTRGSFGVDFFEKLQKGSIFINASRGEVIDEIALEGSLNKLSSVILDVWNNEPKINSRLLNVADISTPHIAGYSLEGKINATVMSVNSFGKYFGIDDLANFRIEYPKNPKIDFKPNINHSIEENLFLLLNESFPIFDIVEKLKHKPDSFEDLRNNYDYRRELTKDIMEIAKNLIDQNYAD